MWLKFEPKRRRSTWCICSTIALNAPPNWGRTRNSFFLTLSSPFSWPLVGGYCISIDCTKKPMASLLGWLGNSCVLCGVLWDRFRSRRSSCWYTAQEFPHLQQLLYFQITSVHEKKSQVDTLVLLAYMSLSTVCSTFKSISQGGSLNYQEKCYPQTLNLFHQRFILFAFFTIESRLVIGRGGPFFIFVLTCTAELLHLIGRFSVIWLMRYIVSFFFRYTVHLFLSCAYLHIFGCLLILLLLFFCL